MVKYVCEHYSGSKKIDACSQLVHPTPMKKDIVPCINENSSNDDRVRIDLYTESLCPGCM